MFNFHDYTNYDLRAFCLTPTWQDNAAGHIWFRADAPTVYTIERQRCRNDGVPPESKDKFGQGQLNPRPNFALNCPLYGGFTVRGTRAYAFIVPRCSVV